MGLHIPEPNSEVVTARDKVVIIGRNLNGIDLF
jgi:hypothetical protein